jgi:diguanylate cyclase (GGDEF)-like protein
MFGVLFIAIIGAPASVLRALSTGWLHLYTIHTVVALMVVFFFIFKKKIPYPIKTFFIIALFILIGVIGLFTLGVLSAGIWWLIVSSFLISTVVSVRAGTITVFLIMLLIIVAGYLFSNEIITIPVDANAYVKSPLSWISLIIATTIMPIVVFQTISFYQHATIKLLKEINDQKRHIERMSSHDQLTGLFLLKRINRYLKSSLALAKKSGKKVVLLFIDLDGFKAVNDNFGHDFGDNVLIKIAHRMSEVSKNKGYVGRIGGDEFVVVLPDVTELDSVRLFVKKLISEINKPISEFGDSVVVGASIGISVFPDNSLDPDQLKKSADFAMYEVKRKGKNDFLFASN